MIKFLKTMAVPTAALTALPGVASAAAADRGIRAPIGIRAGAGLGGNFIVIFIFIKDTFWRHIVSVRHFLTLSIVNKTRFDTI